MQKLDENAQPEIKHEEPVTIEPEVKHQEPVVEQEIQHV
jgi:hypothetical protein